MGKTLYLECSSGISGDMTVAALLDLGASETHLREALATLPMADEFEVAVSRVQKGGLCACDFDVRLDAALENHDHDMAWLFGHLEGAGGHEHEHEHDGGHEHGHGHGCEHGHEHAHGPEGACASDHEHGHGHAHHHEHRTLADITAIIDASGLTEQAKKHARAIFGKLAEAEASVHGATPETVHFHEVGATDSIVDICSVAVCLDDLGVTDVIVPALAEGAGTIRCAHGIMPIPVPAVAALCQRAGIALERTGVAGELVTPTGAAVVAALRTGEKLPGRYRIVATGTGAGKRAYKGCSELLRAMLVEPVGDGEPLPPQREGHPGGPHPIPPVGPGEMHGGPLDPGEKAPHGPEGPHGHAPEHCHGRGFATEAHRHVIKLECDLDDCTGEALGYTISRLIETGAREAHAFPIVMKKGRPGWQLEVVCDAANEEALERLIFENTTTIGIRSTGMHRSALPRRTSSTETPFGSVATKVVTLPDGSERSYPEYDSVVEACRRTGASFQDVFRAAQR